jgi:hypothetical protein
MDKCGTYAGYLAHRRAKEPTCVDCRTANNAYSKQYLENNPEKLQKKLARDKQWQLNNPEKVSAKYKRYYDANSEKQIAKSRRWRDENPEKDKTTRSIWWKNNADKARLYNSTRRARRLSNPREPYTEQQVLDTYGTLCYICGTEIDFKAPRRVGTLGWENGLHLDHVTPIKHGGADSLENVKPAHGICNIKKQATKINTNKLEG